jgi:hypothetical protein
MIAMNRRFAYPCPEYREVLRIDAMVCELESEV